MVTSPRVQPAKEPGARVHSAPDERGATLILALIFIVAVSIIVIPLANWAASSLRDTTNFQKVSTVDYALSSAVNTAIESIRTAPEPSSPSIPNVNDPAPQPIGVCWSISSGTTSSVTLNGYTVNVWCQTTINLETSSTRVVTLYACLSTYGGGSLASCEATPQLQAQVTFDDYSGAEQALLFQCNIEAPGSCGSSQTLDQWTWASQAT